MPEQAAGRGIARLVEAIPILVLLPPILFAAPIHGAEELEASWVLGTSSILPGMNFGDGGGPTVWDVDGDGCMEVLVLSRREGRLLCLGLDRVLEWIFPAVDQGTSEGGGNSEIDINISVGSVGSHSKVSLVDVDGDGVYELSFFLGRILHVITGGGGLVWSWVNPVGYMSGPPQACDVDGDGSVEFFVADDSGQIHGISAGGRLVWSRNLTGLGDPVYGGAAFQPTICDLDQDGEYELVWANSRGSVHCVGADTGVVEWTYRDPGGYPTGVMPPVLVADVNNDREYEVLAWTSRDEKLLCLTFYGTKLWGWENRLATPKDRHCPALGDADGDGGMDVVMITNWGGFCVDVSGAEPLTRWEVNLTRWGEDGLCPPITNGCEYVSYQSLADVDGDGGLEVLWVARFPVVVDAVSGRLEAFFFREYLRPEAFTYPGWWGDLEGDGSSEWICELEGLESPQNDIWCLGMGEFPASSPWPEYYHTAYPAEYQREQDWLTLKSAGSNSLWFPIREAWIIVSVLLLTPTLTRRRTHSKPHM